MVPLNKRPFHSSEYNQRVAAHMTHTGPLTSGTDDDDANDGDAVGILDGVPLKLAGLALGLPASRTAAAAALAGSA